MLNPLTAYISWNRAFIVCKDTKGWPEKGRIRIGRFKKHSSRERRFTNWPQVVGETGRQQIPAGKTDFSIWWPGFAPSLPPVPLPCPAFNFALLPHLSAVVAATPENVDIYLDHGEIDSHQATLSCRKTTENLVKLSREDDECKGPTPPSCEKRLPEPPGRPSRATEAIRPGSKSYRMLTRTPPAALALETLIWAVQRPDRAYGHRLRPGAKTRGGCGWCLNKVEEPRMA